MRVKGYKCIHDEVVFWHLSNSSQTKGGTDHNGHTSLTGDSEDSSLLVSKRGGGREAYKTVCLLPQTVRCCWGCVHFLVRFSNVNLQATFEFEVVVTMVTLKSFLSSWSTELLPQKLFSPPGISS